MLGEGEEGAELLGACLQKEEGEGEEEGEGDQVMVAPLPGAM